MDNTVDSVKNSFIANVNLLVHKLELLLELNVKFSDEDVQRLVEVSKLNLKLLIEDMELGDYSIVNAIVTNMENLKELLDKYPEYKEYGKYFDTIIKNLNMLQVVNDSLPKLIFDTKSVYNSLDMLKVIYDSLDRLPDDVQAIYDASKKAQDAANELKFLSIAVDDAPYGQVGSGSYNPDTGMLTLKVPQGRKGDKGDIGTSLNVKNILLDVTTLPVTGKEGDAYLIGNNLYVWLSDANKWENVGPVSMSHNIETIVNTNTVSIAAHRLRLETIENALIDINTSLEKIISG